MDWSQLVLVVLSLAWGAGSALVPVLNAETYVVAAQVARPADPGIGLTMAAAVATGQAVGKVVLFLASRRGVQLAFLRRRRRSTGGTAPTGRNRQWRQQVDVVIKKLLALVSSPRWGIPIVGLAAVFGIPPIYAVALIAGASRMRLAWFALTVWAGRVVRFLVLAESARHGIVPFLP